MNRYQPQELWDMMKNQTTLVIDVRDIDFDGGNIRDARHIPYREICGDSGILNAIVDECRQFGIKHVVFCCQYGQRRSRLAAGRFSSLLTCDDKVSVAYVEGGYDNWKTVFPSREHNENLDY